MIKGRFTMKYLIYLTLPSLLVAQTSFITATEYSSQLYKNPRGIGCQYCHGEKGAGKLVANYMEKGEKKSFGGPPINNLEWSVFYFALNKSIDGMPRYYLTQKEIEALYLYLNEEKLRKEQEAIPKRKPQVQVIKEEPQVVEQPEPKVQKPAPVIQKPAPKKELAPVQKQVPKNEIPVVKKEEPVVKKEPPKMLRYEDYPD